MNNIPEIIAIASLVYVIVASKPFEQLRRWFGFHKASKIRFYKWLGELLSCALCFGFWFGAIYTGSLFEAAEIAITAEIIYKVFQYFTPIKFK